MTGSQLKSHYNLDIFSRVYIQKVLNSSVPIYVLSLNSRYRNQHIPRKLLQFNRTSMLYRFKGRQSDFTKLSPPMLIEEFKGSIGPRDFILIRDLGAERYLIPRNIIPAKNIFIGNTTFATN